MPDDLREMLEKAYNEEEEASEELIETTEAPEKEEVGKEDPTVADDGVDEAKSERSSGKETDPVTDTNEPVEKDDFKAPIGFSPESREKWKDVPPVVKEQIQRREREIEEAMRGTAEARRSHTQISQLAQSYASVLAAEGAENPMQAIEGLFKTVASLRLGTPQQRATRMAGLISHYGVDINMLDQALAGETPQNQESSQLQQLLDQRLAPIQELLDQQKQSQRQMQEQTQAQVQTELVEFSKTAEFLNDVRLDMADLIDLASKQGRKLSFKDAYDKCCAMNPSISKVLEERRTAAALKGEGSRLDAKRNAGSSLKASSGQRAGNNGAALSLRSEIANAWDDYSS